MIRWFIDDSLIHSSNRSVPLSISSGALKVNVSMMVRQWLTGDGVIGRTTESVHIPVGVVYSTKHEPALIRRKYYY